MNIEQITDIAYEVASELEPQFSFDVFDVSESQVIFQDERGLFTIRINNQLNGLLKNSIKAELQSRMSQHVA